VAGPPGREPVFDSRLRDKSEILRRWQWRGVVRVAQFLFGCDKTPDPGIGLAGLLPQFVGAVNDLFLVGLHFAFLTVIQPRLRSKDRRRSRFVAPNKQRLSTWFRQK